MARIARSNHSYGHRTPVPEDPGPLGPEGEPTGELDELEPGVDE